MMDTPLTDELAKLDAAVSEARSRRDEAKAGRAARKRERHEAVREVTADLLAYADAVAFKLPDAPPEEDRPARERELTDAFLDAVRERGLIVHAHRDQGDTVTLVDPGLADDPSAEADRELATARREREAFTEAEVEGLEAERRATDAAQIRDALKGDDPDAIRDAINGPKQEATALTTADL
jgi:hypothetical protein